MLLNDDKLYQQLNEMMQSITNLTDNIRVHPKRYINLRRKNIPQDPNMPDPLKDGKENK
jgi:predicted DNA-binding ribbon-helix-helix protein